MFVGLSQLQNMSVVGAVASRSPTPVIQKLFKGKGQRIVERYVSLGTGFLVMEVTIRSFEDI